MIRFDLSRVGPGPVFAVESLIAARRWQSYALRAGFVAALAAALVVVWATRPEARHARTVRALAEVGELFFDAIVGTQLVLVLLAAPAATAGAICIDRARGTLAHLMVTDLSDAEIVLGKLAARLAPVLGAVACAFPVLALLTLLGGVDPLALAGAASIAIGLAALGCALALAMSLWVGKAHEALLGTYAVFGLWLLANPMLGQLNRYLPYTLSLPIEAEPFHLAFAPYYQPGRVDWTSYAWFLGVSLSVAVSLALVSVVTLRRAALREPRRRGAWAASRFRPLRWTSAKLDAVRSILPGPGLLPNPVLWREWHHRRPSRPAAIVAAVYVGNGLVFGLISLRGGNAGTAAWVNGLMVSIGLLLLSVVSATSLAEERTRGSLDVLMTTPLSTRAIVMGKWLGTARLVPWMTIIPGLVAVGRLLKDHGWALLDFALSLIHFPGSTGYASTDLSHFRAILEVALLIVYILASGAMITSLGLLIATWQPRLGRAIALTVTADILLTVGWLFALLAVGIRPNREGPMMGSPFFYAGQLTFDLANPQSNQHIGWAFFWAALAIIAAAGFLALALATFDRCLGRATGYEVPTPIRRANPIVLVHAET